MKPTHTSCANLSQSANDCLLVQRTVFGDTFDLATADAADLPLDALIPGMYFE